MGGGGVSVRDGLFRTIFMGLVVILFCFKSIKSVASPVSRADFWVG